MSTLLRAINRVSSLFSTDSGYAGLVRAAAFVLLFGALLLFLMEYRGREDQTNRTSPDFTSLEAGPERKEAFLSFFLPIILDQNQQVLKTRSVVLRLREDPSTLSTSQRRRLLTLAEEYEIENFKFESNEDWDTLIRRIDVVPPSLALAQAATESGWGTSRFAREGNNYFGHWCFVQGCGIVPQQRPDGANHEVADFSSPVESVERYFYNLNHHPAYLDLRQTRARLRGEDELITGLKLVKDLSSYSERGDAYIEEISSMIRFNDLTRYDLALSAADEDSIL